MVSNFRETVSSVHGKPGNRRPKTASVDSTPPRPPLFLVQEDQSALTTEVWTPRRKRGTLPFPCPTFPDSLQPVFENILPCIVAKCGHFRAVKVHQIVNHGLK